MESEINKSIDQMELNSCELNITFSKQADLNSNSR